VEAELASSNKESRRLIEQGAVSVDGETLRGPDAIQYQLAGRNKPYLLKVGKRRFARIRVL
jgi:tyrosyl-tRNA synthetase